ncbi:ABC transporter ATP-binding protein [Salinigranum rubrum]|uniref:Molybdate/tungstate import ATP-binding protein WtpC n=1 Tax=Salinigranum rubrum TaxID=755307 RepID=A0A2I8VP13_9EURY|nr:ABC transporter ATP-binding protein [Salinigranum rubrum]AUV83658.1 ABC transporter ATP-binding protein [Salinigranum rubrum]
MLELTALTKSYPGFEFGPVDLSVERGVLSVLGPSGSGKSTLLSLVAGIVSPDGGEVTLDGRSLVGRPLEARRVGVVFQEGALFPHMTARENVEYAATGRDRVDELAGMLEIEGVLDRRPAALSGGERQRVALARTLAADPDTLLLDEPLSSLDTPIRRRLRDQLHDLFASLDIPVVYVTHDQRAATVLGDRLAVLHAGQVEQVDTPDAVLNRPESAFVARFTGSENVFEAGVVEARGDGAVLRVGDVTLQTTARVAVGTTVTACVRPARVRLVTRDAAPTVPTLTGRVRRTLNEGDEYRMTVACGDWEVTAQVRPEAVDRRDVRPGTTVRLAVPADAVHVIATR